MECLPWVSTMFWIGTRALEAEQGTNHVQCLNSWALQLKGKSKTLESDEL